MSTIHNNLFIEKYRPSTLDEYIGNLNFKEKFQSFIDKNEIPHLLFYGKAGGGKTSIAKILVNHIDCDYLYINASDENNVETIRTKVKGFASSKGFRTWKVIILDESDYLTIAGQSILRNLMETFSQSTRFILTCNYPDKIIEPIHSRCQTFKIEPPSKKEIAIRCVDILDSESIQFTPSDIKELVESHYPDMRKIIGEMQSNINNGVLNLSDGSSVSFDTENKIIEVLCSNVETKVKFKEIRKLLSESGLSDYSAFFTMLYKRIDEYATGNIAPTILAISEGDYKSAFVVDKEINAMATIINILNIISKS